MCGEQVALDHANPERLCACLLLELVDVTGVYDYEHAHLPPESWPPTGWYEGWVLGQDVFALGRTEQPIEMRWLVYRRASDDEIR